MRSRKLIFAGIAVASLLIGTAPAALAASPTPTPVPSTPTPSGSGRTIAAGDDGPRPHDPFTYLTLDQCRDQDAGAIMQDDDVAGFGYNHFQWCAWAPVRLQVTDKNDGSLIGQIDYRATFLAQSPENEDRQFTTLIFFDKIKTYYPFKMSGDNTRVQIVPDCALDTSLKGTCTFTTSPTGMQSLNYLKDHPVGVTLRSDQTATATNPYSIMRGTLGFSTVWTSSEASFGTLPVDAKFKQGIRCDSAKAVVPGKANGPACIFHWVRSILNLNINDANINEAATHIREAIQRPQDMEPKPPAGVSKTIPSTLTRTWDDSLIDRQRTASRKACNDAYGPNPGGVDCDEYPMASTLEGSLGTPGPGQGTKNYNFSVRYITSSDNQRAGTWIGAWYKRDHLLPGDTFKVNIFDGPVITREDPPAPSQDGDR